jgi:sec-independent protein translocase protein TatC
MAQSKMTFVEHLADLRRRIIYVCIFFVALLMASLFFVTNIYSYLVSPLTREGQKLMVVSPGEVITVYFAIAGIVSVGITLPFALYQLWRFVEPGLTPVEKRYTLRLLPIMFVMFILGICFGWFVVFPMILHFLLHLASQNFAVMLRAGSYFGFLTGVCLPFGFIFELPIVVVFLTRIGVITPVFLRRIRRFAYLVIVILGVLISPPEMISHLSVVVPMILLYEVSILLSAVAYRKRTRALVAAESQV